MSAILAVLVGGLILVMSYFLLQSAAGASIVSRWVSSMTGQRVEVRGVAFDAGSRVVTFTDIDIGDGFSIASARIDLDLGQLARERVVGRVTLAGVDIAPGWRPTPAPDERGEPGDPLPPVEFGDFTLAITATRPAAWLQIDHDARGWRMSATVDEASGGSGLSSWRMVGTHLSVEVEDGGDAGGGDLAQLRAAITIKPQDGSASKFELAGLEIAGLDMEIRAADGALEIKKASASIDGRALSVHTARLADGHLDLRVDAEGLLSVAVDVDGLPPLDSLLAWREALADDGRGLLAGASGRLCGQLADQEFEHINLGQVVACFELKDGALESRTLVAEIEGIPVTGSMQIDLLAAQPRFALDLATTATITMESQSGISASDVRASLAGTLDSWSAFKIENLSGAGNIRVGNLRVLEVELASWQSDFRIAAGVVHVHELRALALIAGQAPSPIEGEFTLDLGKLSAGLAGTIAIDELVAPHLGSVDVKAQVKATLEGELAFTDVVVTSRGDPHAPPLTGSASISALSPGIPFKLRTTELPLGGDAPTLRGVDLVGRLDSAADLAGRTQGRVDSAVIGDVVCTGIEFGAAFSSHTLRVDALTGMIDGEPGKGRGLIEFDAEGRWRANFRVEATRFRDVSKLEFDGRVDDGILLIDRGRAVLHDARWVFNGRAVLTAPEFTANLRATTAALSIEGALFEDVSIDLQARAPTRKPELTALAFDGSASAARATLGGQSVSNVRAPFSVAAERIRVSRATFMLGDHPGQADLEIDLDAATPPQATLRFAQLPFGYEPLKNVETIALVHVDTNEIDVRSLSAKWGEFTMRGGGRFGVPAAVPGADAGLAWVKATLALEHPELIGINATVDLRGISTVGVAQPELAGSIDIKIKEALVLGDRLQQIEVVADASGGRFTSRKLETLWGEGRIAGRGIFDVSQKVAEYSLQLEAKGLPIGSKMKSSLAYVMPFLTGEQSEFSGKIDGDLTLSGQGLDRAALFQHLRGQGRASIADGKISGSPLIGLLVDVRGAPRTIKVSADTEFKIASAKVTTTRDLVLRSNVELLTLSGWVGFDRKIEYEGRIRQIAGPIDPIFEPYKELISHGGFVPFRVRGTLDNPITENLLIEGIIEDAAERLLDPALWRRLLGEDQ